MTVETFFTNFGHLVDAPNGVQKLRELILQLAVQGKLVPQDPNDEPASVLLERVDAEKARLVKEGAIKKPKPLPDVSNDETFFVLPSPWRWVRLGDAGITQTGTTPKKDDTASFGSDYPFVKPADIYPNHVDYSKEGLSQKGVATYGRLAPKGSVLMVCIGTIGKSNIIERDCSFNQQINSITPYTPIDSYYLKQVLRSPFFQSEAWARSSSTTIAILNKGKWENIPIPLPPLEEQKRIVAKVDQLMALCDELEARQQKQQQGRVRLNNAALDALLTAREPDEFADHWQRISTYFDLLYDHPETIAKLRAAILQLAVQGKLVPQNPDDEPASVLLEKIKSDNGKTNSDGVCNDKFEIPRGWEWSLLGGLVQANRDITYGVIKLGPEPSDGGVTTLRCSDVLFRKISGVKARKISEDLSKEYERTILEGGEILMNVRGTLGGCGVVSKEFAGCNIAREVAMIPIHKELMAHYVLNVISSPYIQEETFNSLRGIAYKGLNLSLLRGFNIPVPPQEEQKRIVAKVDQLMALCDELEANLSLAQQHSEKLMEATVRKLVS